jgi:ribose-phosphate pyrophosphokinase
MADSLLVAGSSHRALAQKVASLLGLSLFPVSIFRFPDGETRVKLETAVAGKQAFVFQTLAPRPNELLIETLLLIDALRRGGASSIILVCPYLAYSRQSVQENGGVSVAARLFADFLKIAGLDGLITMDLHAELVRSFFGFPVEHLSARELFAKSIREQKEIQNDLVVVGPDLGGAKLAARLAHSLDAGLALIEKRRLDAHQVKMLSLLGEVKEKTVLLADDVCSTAGTLTSAAIVCREKGAKRIFGAVTHGLFVEGALVVEGALDLIQESPIEKLFVTDSVPQEEKVLTHPKICVISTAELFARALASSLSRPLATRRE